MGTEFGEAQAHAAQTRLTATTVVVVLGDVFEGGGFQSCVGSDFAEIGVEGIHPRNVSPQTCGLSLYNSSSI